MTAAPVVSGGLDVVPVSGAQIPRPRTGDPQAAAGSATLHHHDWMIREALHAELGRYERWFECTSCGEYYA